MIMYVLRETICLKNIYIYIVHIWLRCTLFLKANYFIELYCKVLRKRKNKGERERGGVRLLQMYVICLFFRVNFSL